MNAGRNLLFSRVLMVVACGALCAISHAAGANWNPVSETKSLHEWATLESTVSGSSATGIQPIVEPIFSFKTGAVDLRALLRSGSTSGAIDVSVFGYAAGAYTVSALTESSSSTVVLGTLNVSSYTLPIWSGTEIHPDAAATPAYIIFQPFGFGHAKFGGSAAPFPAGFSPFDVATLSLTDSNGNIVSTATLTPVPYGYYNALSPLASGTFAPGATGFALIRANTPPVFLPLARVLSEARASLWTGPVPVVPPIIIDPLPPVKFNPATGDLVIHAHGLPASATLTYTADGIDLGTATTDASGNLKIFAAQGGNGSLPATLNLFSVTTVTVQDASGNVLVSASF